MTIGPGENERPHFRAEVAELQSTQRSRLWRGGSDPARVVRGPSACSVALRALREKFWCPRHRWMARRTLGPAPSLPMERSAVTDATLSGSPTMATIFTWY